MALIHGKSITHTNIVTSGLVFNLDASNPASLGTQNFFRATNNPTNTTYWSHSNVSVASVTGISLPTEIIYPTYSRSVFKITETAIKDQHNIFQALTGVTTLGKTETISGYFKAAERTKISLTMHGEGYPVFDLSNGTVTAGSFSNTSNKIRDAGNGWYYCESTFVRTNTTRNYYISLYEGIVYTGVVGSGVYYYDAQVRDSSSLESFVGNSGALELNQLTTGTTWGDLSGVMGNVYTQNRNTDWLFKTDGDTGVWALKNEGLINRTTSDVPGIQIPMNNGFNRSAGTIDIWIKPMKDHVGSHGFFVNADSLSYNGLNGFLWFGGWDQNEVLYARQSNATTCCSDVAFGGFTTNYYYLNSWMNYTFTWNVSAQTMNIYKNGKLIASRGDIPNNVSGTLLSTTGLMFSGHPRGENIQFKGFCNAYRIYNRQLNATEVLQNFVYTSQRFK